MCMGSLCRCIDLMNWRMRRQLSALTCINWSLYIRSNSISWFLLSSHTCLISVLSLVSVHADSVCFIIYRSFRATVTFEDSQSLHTLFTSLNEFGAQYDLFFLCIGGPVFIFLVFILSIIIDRIFLYLLLYRIFPTSPKHLHLPSQHFCLTPFFGRDPHLHPHSHHIRKTKIITRSATVNDIFI